MFTLDIGTLTRLSNTEWIKGFLATLDEEGDMSHASYCFIRDNRYLTDCEDSLLEEYQEFCESLGIDF